MQRGDFYESLIDYLLPLLAKPATEVVNIVNSTGTSVNIGDNVVNSSSNTSNNNLHQIFHMFMVNTKLQDLSQVYKIDSLLYSEFSNEINDSLAFTFIKSPSPMKHHLGWDIFLTRYRFAKKVEGIFNLFMLFI